MKKLGAVLFLAVALVVPALAEKPNMELIPKIGYLFTPEITVDDHSMSEDSAISIGADFFIHVQDGLFVGGGLMWGENTKYSKYIDDEKIGFTNLYAAAKYKFLINGSEDNPFYIYPLAQLGLAVPGWQYDGPIIDYEISEGLYWGLGAGVEIANIVAEFIYGCNYATRKGDGIEDKDFSYTAFRINLGYKFSL